MEDRERYKAGERAIAPIVATVIPALIVTVLMVVTAISSKPREKILVDIASADQDVDPIDTIDDPPEPPPEDLPPPETDVQIAVDVSIPLSVAEVTTPQPVEPQTAPTDVKHAQENAVQRITSPFFMPGMPTSRTAGMRKQFTNGTAGYGDTATEGAVMKALRWLKATQRTDGSWTGNPISNTGLAILTYWAHGETPSSVEFGRTVERALDYLIGAQTGEGDGVRFRGADGNEYAFLIATYALSEAYGMTKNPNAKAAALKGLVRIVRNQSSTGGWDYKLIKTSTRDDMSFAGWALQALKAGKMAGLHPEG